MKNSGGKAFAGGNPRQRKETTRMPVTIGYDQDQKLRISGLECFCPCDHHTPAQDIYVGTGLIQNLPKYIKARNLGTHCVLVADNNTYEVAGRAVEKRLLEAGFSVIPCVIRREHAMDPDERACGEVLLSIQPEIGRAHV